MRHAVTIDFHDTLFQCDDWFVLEVRDLPLRFLNWLGQRPDRVFCNADYGEVARLYREIRIEAIESGIEVDSHECVRRICSRIGVDVRVDQIERGVDEVMRETLSASRPRPGAVELVEELHSAGVTLGVISNAIHHPFLEWSLENAGLLDKFDLVLSSAKAGYYKSRVELYRLAADLLEVSSAQTIHIGDSYRFDVEGASRAGMRTVWLNLSGVSREDSLANLETVTLEGLAPDLLEMMETSPMRQPRVPHAH